MEIYGTTVNMDVLSALEREAKYEANEYDYGRVEQYVRRVIAETRSLSNPFYRKTAWRTEGTNRSLHIQQAAGSEGRFSEIYADRSGTWQLRWQSG